MYGHSFYFPVSPRNNWWVIYWFSLLTAVQCGFPIEGSSINHFSTILYFFWPSHPPIVHISAVLNVSKTGHFLDPPTFFFCWRNIWMVSYLNRIFKGFSPFTIFAEICTSLHGYQKTYLLYTICYFLSKLPICARHLFRKGIPSPLVS